MRKQFFAFLLLLGVSMPYTLLAFDALPSETYTKAKDELTTAVKNRNFAHAKEVLHELMPIMKEDIKALKKEFSTSKTSMAEENLEEFALVIDRKKEIYSQLHHLMNVSPAALRVESQKVLLLVDEFQELGA